MFKVFITNAVVSKGYENTPALKFSESGESVRFRIGASFYDASAENNTRWINKTVKAFGSICERLKKLDIKEGTHLNLEGNLVLDVWQDDEGNEQKVEAVILTDFEFASSSSIEKTGEKNEQKAKESKQTTNGNSNQGKTGGKASVAQQPNNNSGISAFGANSFFSED